jgi:hypothetical protein
VKRRESIFFLVPIFFSENQCAKIREKTVINRVVEGLFGF